MEEPKSDATTFDEERRRKSTAFHEAGHAVVGYCLGMAIDTINISATEYYQGYTSRRRQQAVPGAVDYDIAQGDQSDDKPLADELTYLYAGIVAERLFSAQQEGSFNIPEEKQYDMYLARMSVQDFPEEVQIEFLASAEKRATELLSDPRIWHVLERIAVKVLEDKILGGSLLRDLLDLLPRTQHTMP